MIVQAKEDIVFFCIEKLIGKVIIISIRIE